MLFQVALIFDNFPGQPEHGAEVRHAYVGAFGRVKAAEVVMADHRTRSNRMPDRIKVREHPPTKVLWTGQPVYMSGQAVEAALSDPDWKDIPPEWCK